MVTELFEHFIEKLMIFTLLCCIHFGYSYPPDTLWTRTYAGIGIDEAYGVVETDDGCYLIVGCTQSFGASYYDVFAMKLDANGDSLWLKTYGGVNRESGRRIIRTADSCYVIIGHTYSYGVGTPNASNVYIIKIDSMGDTLWTKSYGKEGFDTGTEVIQEINSNSTEPHLIASGMCGDDACIIKMTESGDPIWANVYGNSDDDCAYDICCVSSGYVFVGTTEYHFAGYKDVYLVKISPDGAFIWENIYGGSWDDWVYSMEHTNENGFVMAGATMLIGGDADAYILCVDSIGEIIWTRTYGSNSSDAALFVSGTSDNCYIITGYTYSSSTESADIYLLKINAEGDTLWTCTYGGTEFDAGYMVIETDDHGYILVGVKNDDIYVIKTAPDTFACRESFNAHIVNDYLFVYPNPCHGNLRLCYSLSASSKVVISVYDVLGRKQSELNYGYMTSGIYQEAINLPNLSPGLYFVKLNTEKYTKIAKIMIAK